METAFYLTKYSMHGARFPFPATRFSSSYAYARYTIATALLLRSSSYSGSVSLWREYLCPLEYPVDPWGLRGTADLGPPQNRRHSGLLCRLSMIHPSSLPYHGVSAAFLRQRWATKIAYSFYSPGAGYQGLQGVYWSTGSSTTCE